MEIKSLGQIPCEPFEPQNTLYTVLRNVCLIKRGHGLLLNFVES